jgi:hypothetical protein
MELKWKNGGGGDIELFNCGRLVGWVDGDAQPYEVHIPFSLAGDMMPCENAKYVTLRQAMRALKETVVVLLIGRGYEIQVET